MLASTWPIEFCECQGWCGAAREQPPATVHTHNPPLAAAHPPTLAAAQPQPSLTCSTAGRFSEMVAIRPVASTCVVHW